MSVIELGYDGFLAIAPPVDENIEVGFEEHPMQEDRRSKPRSGQEERRSDPRPVIHLGYVEWTGGSVAKRA